MILAIGIDAVEIQRCEQWVQMHHKQLFRIFSQEEIAYCTKNITKSAERFAARFAAKEAFYKAMSILLPNQKLPLFGVCKNVSVGQMPNGAPILVVNWDYFGDNAPGALAHSVVANISLTHTTTTATAIVLLSKRGCCANE